MKKRVTWALKWRDDGEWLAAMSVDTGTIKNWHADWSLDKRDRVEFGTRGSAEAMRNSGTWRNNVVLVRITRRRA